jgi:SAM-dependent methyltransferase
LDPDTSGISCCFDEESSKFVKDYRDKGLGFTSKAILTALKSRGVSGSTILELGFGPGALTVELLKTGATSAVGIDLSPKMVEAARTLAAKAGVTNSTSFRLGDGAKDPLPASDIVILDTVICCYPDPEALIDNSSSASRRFYTITIPDDRRMLTRILKRFLPLQRLGLRGKKFRFFIHPTKALINRLHDKGFDLLEESKAGWIWSLLVFAPAAA